MIADRDVGVPCEQLPIPSLAGQAVVNLKSGACDDHCAHWLSATLQPRNTRISWTSERSSATSCYRWVALHLQFSAIAQAAPDKPRGMAKGTMSLDATLTIAQNIGHNSQQGLATNRSTGVTSGPTQLFASALLKTFRRRTGQGTRA